MRLVAFCEASADFDTLSGLVDRVLAEQAAWIAELLEYEPEGVRTWQVFDIHGVYAQRKELGLRAIQGHFGAVPGGPGAAMARTVFQVVRELRRREQIDGVVLVWDTDNDTTRRRGLELARGAGAWEFAIAIGCPHVERESWVLSGFEPRDAAERERCEAIRAEIGFAANEKPQELTAKHDHDKKSVKRVLTALTGGDRDREVACWRETPLATLRARGIDNGLTEFLTDVTEAIGPLCTRT
jgi:hypothetical protein